MKTMLANRVHQYGGELIFEEAAVPAPASGQVLVRVHAAGVNPIDYKLISGQYRDYMPIQFPFIPGRDVSGVVADLGTGVTAFKKGDVVYGTCPNGSYAEYVNTAVESIAIKPARLTHVEAASIPVAAMTAAQALFDLAHLEAGQSLLIQGGSGGVGTFAIQLAHWKGAHVVATASDANLDYVWRLGADEAIDYHQMPWEALAGRFDVVLDLIGGETQQQSFATLKPGGRLIATSQPPDEAAAQSEGTRRDDHHARLGPVVEGLGQAARRGNVEDGRHQDISARRGGRRDRANPIRAYRRQDRAGRAEVKCRSVALRPVLIVREFRCS